jgi:fatty acid desaturase
LFRHPEDKKPVAIFVALTALDFVVYFTVGNVWALVGYWLLMFVPKGLIAPWNHHHQHCMTFRSPVLNRLMEVSYGLHTGMTTHLWVLHHVLGHHVNFLDQTKDESRWKRKSGKKMGVIEYTCSVALTSYYRAFKVGQRYPKQQRIFLTFTALTFGLVAALVYHRPLPALFIFVLPMVCTLFYTSWVTYDHHAGLDSDNHFEASYNIMNQWFNRLTGNLGYHTAHHYKQGLHWSKLPALHAEIVDQIPPELLVKSTFDAFLPDDKVVVEPETETEPADEKLAS